MMAWVGSRSALRAGLWCAARGHFIQRVPPVTVSGCSHQYHNHAPASKVLHYYQHPEEDLTALPRQHYVHMGEYRSEQELLDAGVWPWTQGIRSRLPEHYKRHFLEFYTIEPVPVHYRPEKGRWKKDEYGTLHRVENVPIPLIFPRQADEGLWGGEGIVQGMRKRHNKMLKPKTPRVWKPYLFRRVFYSEILDEYMAITVTLRLLDLVDQSFGFDHYILQTPEIDMRSRLGMTLKREMLLALARKSMYPDDPDKCERIYDKFSKYVIPEEEAEWVGLLLEEAEKKQLLLEEQEQLRNLQPLKEQLALDLIEKLKKPPTGDSEVENTGWMARLNPFKENPSTP